MFGLGIAEMVIVLLVLGMLLAVPVALIVIVVLQVRGRVVVADEQVARGRRHQVVVSVLAALAAAAAVPLGLVLGGWLGQSPVLPLLPSAMVVAACLALWVGELTFPRPAGPMRSTVLNDRSLETVLPQGWIRTCEVLAGVVVVVFVVGAVTADGGRHFTWTDGNLTMSRSPYPGLTYVVPQALALLVAAGLTWLVCQSVATRPTISSDLEGDAVLRRAAAGRALRWLAWGLAATAAGDLFIAGLSVRQAPGWGPVGAVMLGASLVLALGCLALPFVPAPRPEQQVPSANLGAA